MDDPFGFIYYMMLLGQQQAAATTSIFDTITFWVVIAIVVPVLIKFLFVAAAFSSVKKQLLGDTDKYKHGPLGALGPFFGVPAVIPKSAAEIESDRQHTYRKWGTILSGLCILGGLFLFMIGVTGHTDIDVAAIGKIRDAAPGTILFIIGFLFWRHVQK